MGRKKAGGGTPADLGQLKLEVVLDATQAEQFKNLCTILMQPPGWLAKEMVLAAMRKETLQVLKSVALSYSADLPDLQGTLADQYPPGSSQAREKCEGTCSGKCTLAQDTTITDYAIWPEKGLRGGEADEESLQKKQGTPTADQYLEHSGHSQGTNTRSVEASDSSRPFERISTTTTRALERIEDDEQFN